MAAGSFSCGELPPRKVRKLDIEPFYNHLMKHKNVILEAVDCLKKQHDVMSFLRIVSSNGDVPCCFTDAWCATERSVETCEQRTAASFSRLFKLSLLTDFIEDHVIPDDERSVDLICAFKKLAYFLDDLEGTNRLLQKQIEKLVDCEPDERLSEYDWAVFFATHILKKLAVHQDLRISDTYKEASAKCICGCGNTLPCGDTSMGNKQVWHGSVDILLGDVAVTVATENEEEDECTPQSAVETKSENLEKLRHQILAKTIVFSCAQSYRVVPTIAIDHESLQIFIYDSEADLLFEGEKFRFRGRLPVYTVLALWLAINYQALNLETTSAHTDVGYSANFVPFLRDKDKLDIYKKEIKLFRCKKARAGLRPLNDVLELERKRILLV